MKMSSVHVTRSVASFLTGSRHCYIRQSRLVPAYPATRRTTHCVMRWDDVRHTPDKNNDRRGGWCVEPRDVLEGGFSFSTAGLEAMGVTMIPALHAAYVIVYGVCYVCNVHTLRKSRHKRLVVRFLVEESS